ncbi:MAG: transcriptional repressor LexA [Patescibacteria group bacterium]
MGKTITKRQKQLLGIIYEFFSTTGYPPSFEEMRESLGVASNQSIVDLLEKLKKANLIKKDEGARSLAIKPLGYEILGRPALAPILGTTTAGTPAETIEITGQWQKLSPSVARLEAEVFMLKVLGDSMINAGIDDGDAVLVQTKKEFTSGEIVYAQIGDEGTIKRFMSDDKPPYVYLKPENPKYELIPFTHEMELKGKIISVLKNGHWKSI